MLASLKPWFDGPVQEGTGPHGCLMRYSGGGVPSCVANSDSKVSTTRRTLVTSSSPINRMVAALLAESWERSSKFTVNNRPKIV